jgi:hypothetical protein
MTNRGHTIHAGMDKLTAVGGPLDGSPVEQYRQGRKLMSGTLVNLIVQVIAGAIGGNVAGTAGGNTINLGAVLNSVVGAIGGGVGGQILTALIPMLSGPAGNIDITALVGQAAGGGVAGAILTAIVGVIKNKMAA